MQIRSDQMAAMSENLRREFVEEMAAHLRQEFRPRLESLDDAALRRRVEDGIAGAARYGVTARGDIRRYLESMVVHGWDFDTSRRTAWAGAILRRTDLSGEAKMIQIADQSLFQAGD
jgi:hypothetical protein